MESPGANGKANTGAITTATGDARPLSGPSSPSPCGQEKPADLLDEIASFIASAAPHPNNEIALAGAIALLSGICGRCYNTYTGAGLNQYILMLASTGMGKEAAASGWRVVRHVTTHTRLA